MAKKSGLGTGVNSLLKGSARQRQKQAERAGVDDDAMDATTALSPDASSTRIDRVPANGANGAGPDAAERNQQPGSAAASPGDGNDDRLLELPITEIRAGSYQPRRTFEKQALQELADSLKQQGLIQPILVRAYAGRYEIIAGERRWRAAQLAGLKTLPVIVRDLDDRSVAAISLIENIQRKDLNPLEEAGALKRLRDEFGMTQEAVAESVGRSRAAVANILRLLDLHDDVKLMLESGEIDMGHARALLTLDPGDQTALAEKVAREGLSVRATEALVREFSGRSKTRKGKTSKTAADKKRDPNIMALERDLGDQLGAQVSIHQENSGKGRLEISYNSLDELDGILKHIKS